MHMECEEIRDQMLDVLYGEADASAVASFERHTANCPSCRDELAQLKNLRVTLSSWTLPRQRRSMRRLAPPRYFWAAAAAALVILALGGALSLAGVEMRFTQGPVVVRLGNAPPIANPAPVAGTAQPAVVPVEIQPVASSAVVQEDAVLQRVAEMIRQSEARQRMAYVNSLGDFEARTTRQRRYDMARIGAGLSYLDGRTGQHMARTTELMGYVLQASNRREP
jgi:hypothetical protein